MLKFSSALISAVILNSALFSIEVEANPIRRSPAMWTRSHELALLQSDVFEERLAAMVIFYHENKHNVTFKQINRLITQNPAHANPYLGAYDAHLITLASRWGMLDVVQAIAENNQSSIHCRGNGGQLDENDIFTCYGAYTPLDEAVAFRQKAVAKYLLRLDASMFTVDRADLHRLVDRPNKKRKR